MHHLVESDTGHFIPVPPIKIVVALEKDAARGCYAGPESQHPTRDEWKILRFALNAQEQ